MHLHSVYELKVRITFIYCNSPYYPCLYITKYFKYNIFYTEPTSKPCDPSPCGPNSICRDINNQAICACLESYIGNPPNCRPECIQSTDCPPSQACINRKCQDPCPGSCGNNAVCNVYNHNPICSCPPKYTGSPFTHCYGKIFL
jgi:hypothetical protein